MNKTVPLFGQTAELVNEVQMTVFEQAQGITQVTDATVHLEKVMRSNTNASAEMSRICQALSTSACQ
ncbi:MAG: hypothetical protein JXR76_09190 [Deltaproteobacteria bacterium]|nr:hypothetical protein [Deltaproteobacteria bacterium]